MSTVLLTTHTVALAKTYRMKDFTEEQNFSVFEFLLVEIASTSLQSKPNADAKKQQPSKPTRRR